MSTAISLNGSEIRASLKEQHARAVDSLPMMKQGNTYHAFKWTFGYEYSAFPADVPLPSPFEDTLSFIAAMTPEYKAKVQAHIDNIEELKKLRDSIDETLSLVLHEGGDIAEEDSSTPDLTREKFGLEPVEDAKPRTFVGGQ